MEKGFKSAYSVKFKMISTTLVLMFVLIVSLAFVPSAYAQEIVYGDTVPAGQVVQNDIILTGNVVQMDGTVEGDLLALGTTIEINGEVQGSLIAIGQNITINGEIDGSVYTAGGEITIGSEAYLARNLYLLSLQLNMEAGSQVARDVYAVSPGGATLEAQIGREVVGVFGPVELIRALLVWIQEISGSEFFQNLLDFLPQQSATPGGQNTNTLVMAGIMPFSADILQQGAGLDSQAILDWLLVILRHLITLLAIGGLAMWLLPKWMFRSTNQIRIHPWSALGWGLIVVLIGYLLLGLVSIGVILISAFFFAVTLSSLGSIVLSGGLAAVMMAGTFFSLLVTYVSKVIFVVFVGEFILVRFRADAASSRVWPLLLGATIYVLLRAIPFLGWVIGVVATLIGVGAMWLVFQAHRQGAEYESEPGELIEAETTDVEVVEVKTDEEYPVEGDEAEAIEVQEPGDETDS